MPRRARVGSRWWLRTICALVCSGCAAPDFTERRALADPAMRLEPEPTEGHFRRKATDAREAGAGGGGATAGGGCGCY